MSSTITIESALEEAHEERSRGNSKWTWTDGCLALAFGCFGFLVRLPLISRIEGMLDHDQATVGLMALDIANGVRLPIFFDGQRYIGVLEPYTAALFTKLFGHSPAIVSLAPLFYFAVFTAEQFIIWRIWKGRSVGCLAALLTALGSPMLAVWSVASRGGYTVILAWALPVLAGYRWVCQARAPLSKGRSACLGVPVRDWLFSQPALTRRLCRDRP